MLAESRERSIDQARIDRGKFFVAQAQRFERTGPVVLHEHVGSQNQFFQNVSVSRLFEVERKRTFVGSLREVSRAHLATVELPVGAGEPALVGIDRELNRRQMGTAYLTQASNKR